MDLRHWCEGCQTETWCDKADGATTCVCTACGKHKDGFHA